MSKSGRVTIRQIAAAASVSHATASDIVNRNRGALYSDATCEKVREAARRLGYAPLRAAQRLRQASTKSIGVLITHHLDNPFSNRMAFRAEARLEAAGAEPVLVVAASHADKVASVPSSVTSQAFNGVLIGPVHSYNRRAVHLLGALRELGIPVVSFGHGAPEDQISLDLGESEAGPLAVNYLLAAGHRKIGFIASPTECDQPGLFGFAQGVADALRRADALSPTWFHKGADRGRYPEFFEHSRRWVDQWLAAPPEDRPTAVICKNDQAAITTLKALHDSGVRVPTDLSVMGHDNLAETAYTIPPLTTIDADAGPAIDAAVDHLLRLLEDPKGTDHRLKHAPSPRVVERESVGAAP